MATELGDVLEVQCAGIKGKVIKNSNTTLCTYNELTIRSNTLAISKHMLAGTPLVTVPILINNLINIKVIHGFNTFTYITN